jgi:hypothetical protein
MYTTEQQIQDRINEIDAEAAEIRQLKAKNRLTVEDVEDISENYQYNLEWTYALSELQDKRNELIKQRNAFHTVEQNESLILIPNMTPGTAMCQCVF